MINIITINQPFSEQYTLLIHSEIKGINVHMISTSQMRWDFTVIHVEQKFIEIRLVLLDHVLVEANNPLIKEVSELTKAFNRLYNELHLKINNSGKIIEILNMDLIFSKWKQTKKEMEEIAENSPDIKNAILLNDNIFKDPNKLKEGMQNSEFFLMYFNKIYGKHTPSTNTQLGANFFNSANIDWKFHLNDTSNPLLSNEEVIIELFGEPSPISLNSTGFKNKAYIQFANQIDVKQLTPSLKEKGIFRINTISGRMVEASLIREEIADAEKLYTKMKYTFYSEEIYKHKLLNENNTD